MGFLKNIFISSSKEETSSDEKKTKEKNFDILKFDGIRAEQIEQFSYAERCFKEALLLKDDFETMNHLANTYIRQNENIKAIELLKTMCEKEPADLNIFLTLANVYYMEENYQDMVDILHKAHYINEKSATIQYLFAKAYKGLKDNVQTIATLTQALVLKEDFIEARLMRAETLLEMNCYKEAEEDIDYCLSLNSDNEEALILKAEIAYATKRLNEAEENYIKVTEVNPFNEKSYLALCHLYIEQKKCDKAIEKMDEAIEINPQFAKAYKSRGEAKLLNGDKNGSVEDLKKALELDPDSEKDVNGKYDNFNDLYRNNIF